MSKIREEHKEESSSSYAALFSMFDKAGVSQASKWRSLFLYFREMKDYTHLSDIQKTEVQTLLTSTLSQKDYSDKNLKKVLLEYRNIVISPYKRRIEDLLREASGIITSFKDLMSSRYGDIVKLEDTTISCVESETDERALVEKLREAFQDVKTLLENDVRSLEALASKDPLTGIANRRAFDAFITSAVGAWRAEGRPVSLALFDIDFFKRFNDEHGHRIGDQVLIVVAKQLTRCIQELGAPESDVLAARYGGEEFVVAVSGPCTKKLPQLAERIRLAVKNFNFLIRDACGNVVENGLRITISAGMANAWSGWSGAYEDNLIDSADKALYFAKQAGRDRTVAFNPETDPSYTLVTSPEK